MCTAHHTPILYDFTGYVRFSSLSTIYHSFLIHFIYLNLSHNQCINNIFIYLHIFLAVIVKLSKQKLDNLYCFDFSTAKKESQSR